MSYNSTPLPVSPIVKLSGYDDKEWENFIEECVEVEKNNNKYLRVIAFGGAGDKGRDICAYTQHASIENTWDLYQAKHYGSQYTNPTTFFPELAMFFDMLITKQYTVPRTYFLCTLKIGPKLIDYFLDKEKFKKEFNNVLKSNKGVFSKYQIASELNNYLEYINRVC